MSDSDAQDEKVLRDNLRVPPLSPEALARIRRATEAEWRAQTGGSPRRLWIPRVATAAGVALALIATWQFWPRGIDATGIEPLAQLARTEGEGIVKVHWLWANAAVTQGSDLRAGMDYEIRGASLLELRGGGNVRLAANSKIGVLSANTVRLERGELYVDIPPGGHTEASFVAITDAGEFRHLGTQFALSVADGTTRLRVREGTVNWRAAGDDSLVPAGTEVLIRDRQVTRTSVDSAGPHWSWTETIAPEFAIEGRPLDEFLDWVARETGRRVEIADTDARRQVETIRMHGNIRGLPPMQALQAVMISTSLRFDLPEGAIRVSSAGDPQPSRQ